LSAVGGARTPISQAIIETGLFVGLIVGIGWASEHGAPFTKMVIQFMEIPALLVGFFLVVRLFVVIGRETGLKPGKRDGNKKA
jgi:hypothetical protein